MAKYETKAIALDINSHLHFIDSQMKSLELSISNSENTSVKDLVDYHRYAESMMFLAKAREVIE